MMSRCNTNDVLRILIDSSPTAIIIVDTNGMVNMWNKEAERIFGWKEEEVLGGPNPIVPPDKQVEYQELLNQVLHNQPFSGLEVLRRRKDGSSVYINISSAILRDEDGVIIGVLAALLDVTERKQLEEKLKLYEEVFENTLQGVMITEKNRDIILVNSGFTRITGYALEDVYGKNPRILQSGKHDRQFYEQLWLSIDETGQWQGEIWNKFKEGNIYPQWLNISVVKKGTEITNYVGVFSDISELKNAEQQLREVNEKLRQLSSMDGLTGIPNRRYFDEFLEHEWKRGTRDATPLSLIMVDIDFFKGYNDHYGHLAGDDCLKHVAEILKITLKRETDLAARFGGEEFALILPDTNLSGAKTVAEDLLRNVEGLKLPHALSSISPFVTVSAGVASIAPNQVTDPRELIESADQALYQAKLEGRNRIRWVQL